MQIVFDLVYSIQKSGVVCEGHLFSETDNKKKKRKRKRGEKYIMKGREKGKVKGKNAKGKRKNKFFCLFHYSQN